MIGYLPIVRPVAPTASETMRKLYTSYSKGWRAGSRLAPAPEPLGCGIVLLILGAGFWVLADAATQALILRVLEAVRNVLR